MRRAWIFAPLLMAGCAKMPDDIAPAPVSADPYMQMPCRNLASQRQARAAELERAEEHQTETSNRDAAWMTIVHIPVGSMTRGDIEPHIARLKGEITAINRAAQAKGCFRG